MKPLYLALLLLLAGCTRAGGEAAPTEADLAALPDQESWGAVLRISESGRLRVVLEAPYAARYERPDSTFTRLSGDPAGADTVRVRVSLFDDGGAPSATVHANTLIYDDRERRFEAEGRVVVETGGGRRLESERVTWNEAERRLRAPGRFRFTSPAERITGTRLVAAEDLSRYTFASASGQLEVEE